MVLININSPEITHLRIPPCPEESLQFCNYPKAFLMNRKKKKEKKKRKEIKKKEKAIQSAMAEIIIALQYLCYSFFPLVAI